MKTSNRISKIGLLMCLPFAVAVVFNPSLPSGISVAGDIIGKIIFGSAFIGAILMFIGFLMGSDVSAPPTRYERLGFYNTDEK